MSNWSSALIDDRKNLLDRLVTCPCDDNGHRTALQAASIWMDWGLVVLRHFRICHLSKPYCGKSYFQAGPAFPLFLFHNQTNVPDHPAVCRVHYYLPVGHSAVGLR